VIRLVRRIRSSIRARNASAEAPPTEDGAAGTATERPVEGATS
jgi:hypothetical protein